MSETKKAIEDFYGDLKDYMNTRLDLAGLITVEKMAGLLSNLITKGTFILFFFFALFFGSMALCYYVGERLGNIFSGFMWVAAGYFLLGILFLLIKDSWLKTPILNAILKQFYKNEPDNAD